MKNLSSLSKYCVVLLASFIFVASAPTTAFAVNFPEPVGFANDFAGVLTQEEQAQLETILVNFEKSTSNEIVVAIVNSFEGLDRFSYSQQLFTEWGIGKKDKNNGILFLVGPDGDLPFPEHGQAFINVGRGLEGALPDSVTGSILRSEVFPNFKAGNVANGIGRGIIAIIQATRGEYTTSSAAAEGETSYFGYLWIGFVFLSYLASYLARTKSWWLGGVIGAVLGGIIGVFLWTGIYIAVSAGIFGALGLVFDFVLSRNYAYRKAHGKPTDFWHSGGGFWRGGRGGLGGGFGGFGGGISGGGGAGGRW